MEAPRFEPLSWSGDSKRLAYVREAEVTEPAGETRQRLFTADVAGGEHAVALHREEISPSDEERDRWALDSPAA